MDYRPGRVHQFPHALSRLLPYERDGDEEVNDEIPAYTDFRQYFCKTLTVTTLQARATTDALAGYRTEGSEEVQGDLHDETQSSNI